MSLPNGVRVRITTGASGDNPQAESRIRTLARGDEKFEDKIESRDRELEEIINLARELIERVDALTVRTVNECRVYVNHDTQRFTRTDGHFVTVQGR